MGVSDNEIGTAFDDVKRLLADWKRFNLEDATEADIALTLHECVGWQSRLRRSHGILSRLHRATLRLEARAKRCMEQLDVFGYGPDGAVVVIGFLVACVAFPLFALALGRDDSSLAFFATGAIAILAATLFVYPAHLLWESEPDLILADEMAEIATFRHRRDVTRERHLYLSNAHQAKCAFETARRRYDELCRQREAQLQAEAARLRREEELRREREARERAEAEFRESRLGQMLASNWRSLRGTSFEQFLGEVFKLLGHAVQATGKAGDNGLDLIVRVRGRRLGVQVKGWANPVGLHAVQEATFGRDFYRCDVAMVITNSTFTRQARRGAKATGCLLIDSGQIRDLIKGKIL